MLIVSLGLGACGEDFLCTLDVEPAVVVQIRDAITSASIGAIARGVIVDGAYTDSMRVHWFETDGTVHSRRAGDGRPGVYEVRLEAEGYLPWMRTGVRVRDGRCGVITEQLQASMVPAS
jgi:hypothetical protein